jgi:outer membrane protein TolC
VRHRSPQRRTPARGLLAGIALATLAAPVTGAETLQDAWALALGRDPALAAVRAEADAAAAGERAARGARWPTLEASAGYTRYDEAPSLDVATPSFAFRSPPIFDDDDMVMGGARLSVPLWTGGALSASIRSARHAREAAEALGEQAVADLKLEVAARYVGVLRARRGLAAAEANVASLEAHVADVQALVERELVAQSDLLAARVALANARQQRVRADNAVQLAHAAYNRHLGQPLDRVPEIEDRGALAGLPEETRGIDELLRVASSRRSELRALDARASALEAQARAERGRLLPQLSLEGSYQHLETTILDRQDFTSVGVGLRWTVFDGGQTLQRARSLERSGRAARHRREDFGSQLELQVREAWLGLAEAAARRVATREAVAEADENLRISRELYGAGLASNTQVLEAVALRVSAAGNRDDAALDAELARLRLARAIGEL